MLEGWIVPLVTSEHGGEVAAPGALMALGIGALLAGRPLPARASFDDCFFPIRLVTSAPKPGGEMLAIDRQLVPSGTRGELEYRVISSRCGLGTGQLVESEDRLEWSGSFPGCPGESLAFTVRGRCPALRLKGSRRRIAAPHRRRRVRAKPSVCGDGFIDLARREACERKDDASCRPGGRCVACRCVGTPAAPPSVSIDQVSCSIGRDRAIGACGVGAFLALVSSGAGRAQGPVGTILGGGPEFACDTWPRVECDFVACCGRGSGDPDSTGWSDTSRIAIGCGPLPPEMPTRIGIGVTGPFDTTAHSVTRSFICRFP